MAAQQYLQGALRTLTDARHAWMSYMTDKPPPEDPILQRKLRVWEPERHVPVMSGTKSNFITYNTYVLSPQASH